MEWSFVGIEGCFMLKYIRGHNLLTKVQRCSLGYEPTVTRAQRLKEQLRRFNQCWPAIRFKIPFYRELALRNNLPDTFRSWEEIIDVFPVVNRAVVQLNVSRLTDQSKSPQRYRITGGSTAQPIQMPAWKSEDQYTSPDIWLGRSWYGIKPNDRLFMLWGHSHLLGSGWKGLLNRHLREWKDRLLGYYRFSAYNINSVSMQAAAKAVLSFSPRYIIGYSVALDAFARSNFDKTKELRALGLKAVIGAAEGFPSVESIELISRVTGAPVAMEYGSVETNLVAHTHPHGGYRVFWQTYFIEALEEGSGGGKVVRITSLYPRCFPLIRYEMGDEVELDTDKPSFGVERFERVIGRCNDYLVLKDGSRVHSELITHAVRSCKNIMGYQALQTGAMIRLSVTSPMELLPEVVEGIKYRLGKIHLELASVPVERVAQLYQTVAGKTPIIVRDNTRVEL